MVCGVDVDELKIMRNLPTGALDPGSLGRARVSSSPPSRLANIYAKEKFLYNLYQAYISHSQACLLMPHGASLGVQAMSSSHKRSGERGVLSKMDAFYLGKFDKIPIGPEKENKSDKMNFLSVRVKFSQNREKYLKISFPCTTTCTNI